MSEEAFVRAARQRIAELDRDREALWATLLAEAAPRPDIPARKLVSVAEAMAALSRSRSSVWRDIRDGRLKAVNIGRSVRITAESLDRMVEHGAPLEEAKRRRLRVVD